MNKTNSIWWAVCVGAFSLFSPVYSQVAPPTPQPGAVPVPSVPVVPNPSVPSISNVPAIKGPLESMEQKALTPKALAGDQALDIKIDFAAGRGLGLFGRSFFSAEGPLNPLEVVPVYEDYTVGPGDEILIRAWGQVDINLRLVVDRNGAINIPKVGVLPMANLKANQLEGFIKGQVGRIFKNFEMNVTLGKLRSIQVLVVGQASRPGKYTISAWSSLVHALIASGGPSGVGSMRKIQVKRGGQIINEFDLYDLLLKGDKSKDIRLQHGDMIFIPIRGDLVGVTGNVKVPAIYEMKGAETVGDIIDYAGGFTALAYTGRVNIERIKDHKQREIKELDLENEGGKKELVRDGDLIHVVPVSPRFDKVVTLAGHVAVPKRVNWKDGMRITDLIPNRADLIPIAYWNQKNQLVGGTSEGGGETSGAGSNEFRLNPEQVRKFRFLELVKGARKLLAEVNWEYATIMRIDPETLQNIFITFNLGDALRENDPEHNLLLRAGDVITIYARGDIRLPKSKRQEFVTVEGEINKPGLYELKPGETLKELVIRAGGFTSEAYLYASVFTRDSVRLEQEKRMAEGLERMEKEMERSSARLQAETTTPELKESYAVQMAAKQRSIARVRSSTAIGRVVLNFPLGAQTPEHLPNLELKDGDVLIVPSKMSEVHLFGEVYNQQSTIWKPGVTVLAALTSAGGPTKNADVKSMFIIRADGTIYSREQGGRRFTSVLLSPGDSIVVPEDLDFLTWKHEVREWAQIFTNFALGAAAIKVLSD